MVDNDFETDPNFDSLPVEPSRPRGGAADFSPACGVEADLARINDIWNAANGEVEVDAPDGNHVAVLSEVLLTRTKKTGELAVYWTWHVAQGQAHAGARSFACSLMRTEQNISYLKRDLARLGVCLKDMKVTDLPALLQQVQGCVAEIKIETQGKYRNTYIQRLITPAAVALNGKIPF